MANIFSGISDFLSGGQMKDALERLARSSNTIYDIEAPKLSELIPTLQLQVQQGTMSAAQAQATLAQVVGRMDPAVAEAQMQEASGMGLVQSDQASIAGQREQLARLKEIADTKGLTEADKAQFTALMNQANANAAQQREAQLQQLQMQGQRGGGAELAARLQSSQGGANAGFAAGADLARGAQARALQAIQAGLQGNANLNTQLFDQAAKKAQAQDMVNQFNAQAQNQIRMQNAQNQQAANMANFQTGNQFALANQQAQNQAALANAGYQNQANMANFNMANQIAGVNTGILNQQAMMPYNAAQADFTNQLNKAVAGSTADYRAGGVLADLAGKQMANTAGGMDLFGNIISGLTGGTGEGGFGNLIGEGAGAIKDWVTDTDWWDQLDWSDPSTWFSDEELKTDKHQLSDDEVDKLMGKMTGYRYRYKGDKTNPEQVGVMAQDLPKSSVIDTPAGKMVQKPEVMNQALAVLANQHDRIKKLEGR